MSRSESGMSTLHTNSASISYFHYFSWREVKLPIIYHYYRYGCRHVWMVTWSIFCVIMIVIIITVISNECVDEGNLIGKNLNAPKRAGKKRTAKHTPKELLLLVNQQIGLKPQWFSNKSFRFVINTCRHLMDYNEPIRCVVYLHIVYTLRCICVLCAPIPRRSRDLCMIFQ